MKKNITALLLGLPFLLVGQVTNSFPDDGNVGIGTTSPTEKLHLESSGITKLRLHTESTSSNAGISITGKRTSGGNSNHYIGATGTNSYNLTLDVDENLFINTNGATRMYVKGNGSVGIGTTNPGALFDANGNITFLSGAEKMYWGSKHTGSTDHRNYLAPRLADDSGWDWGQEFGYHFYHRTWYIESNLGIGTTNPGTYKLAVNGSIRAKEVKVETNWADYVFEADYDLPTLEEVEKHIQEKGHLINIPSAKEVEENGIQLGEMNKLLLEKIEELTLYVIEIKKEQEVLKLENRKLKLEMDKISKQ
ncbi:hypothetical protein [Flagellimonas sp. 2504JD4-2]